MGVPGALSFLSEAASQTSGSVSLQRRRQMSHTYRVNFQIRLINRLMQALVSHGLGPKQTYILTVKGRKSGKLYSTPVSLVEDANGRWLVAPYGEVGWLRNARAAGRVTLTRGRHSEAVSIMEVGLKGSALVLRKYIALEPVTQPYFDARADSPLAAFEAEASRHPVFRIVGAVKA
jgi:deazaflavin-dependent oxidoreductase (nitroreductase family)